MKRSALLLASFFCAPLLTADISPPELFKKAKEHFRLGSYQSALDTLTVLDWESQQPGLEGDRSALLPALLFYRGACYAALGRSSEARADFEVFLTYQPNASLDPVLYPKKVIAALEESRRSLLARSGGEPKAPASKSAGSLEAAYREFRMSGTEDQGSLGEEWAQGPVRVLLTSVERRDFLRLSDPVSRSEFVTNFWKSRDPKPETAINELREEFERRVAFADSRFTQEETRGSLTDRGMVFLLLGSPTYVGRKPLTTGEDANDPVGLKRFRMSDLRIAALPGGTTSQRIARIDAVTGPGNRLNEAAANWREVWHYRRERLPKGVPFLQVDFEFVTKKGYGENVLQRDDQALATLERARAGARKG